MENDATVICIFHASFDHSSHVSCGHHILGELLGLSNCRTKQRLDLSAYSRVLPIRNPLRVAVIVTQVGKMRPS